MEALQGLQRELEGLRLENRELRTLLGSSGAQAKKVTLTLRRKVETVVRQGRKDGGNGNTGTIVKVDKTASPVLTIKNTFTVHKERCTGEAKGKTDETTLSSAKTSKIVVVGDS